MRGVVWLASSVSVYRSLIFHPHILYFLFLFCAVCRPSSVEYSPLLSFPFRRLWVLCSRHSSSRSLPLTSRLSFLRFGSGSSLLLTLFRSSVLVLVLFLVHLLRFFNVRTRSYPSLLYSLFSRSFSFRSASPHHRSLPRRPISPLRRIVPYSRLLDALDPDPDSDVSITTSMDLNLDRLFSPMLFPLDFAPSVLDFAPSVSVSVYLDPAINLYPCRCFVARTAPFLSCFLFPGLFSDCFRVSFLFIPSSLHPFILYNCVLRTLLRRCLPLPFHPFDQRTLTSPPLPSNGLSPPTSKSTT